MGELIPVEVVGELIPVGGRGATWRVMTWRVKFFGMEVGRGFDGP